MEEIKQKFIADLLTSPADLLTSIWILDRVPHIFDGDVKAFAVWRRTFSAGLGVDASALFVTGSAAFGVSLNPHKNFRPFSETSDIDVAVVSEHHFSVAWRALRTMGPSIHGLPQRIKQSIEDHVKRYIYWGTIATDKILHLLPFGSGWAVALDEIGKCSPTADRQVKVRIYRDLDSLRAYHVNNLNQLRTEEVSRGL
jgi:hypothetical protein